MKGSFALVAVAAFVGTVQAQAASGPTVDLGYTVHRATINNTGQYPYYNFSNIRFGTPPTGQARFTAASLPTGENKTVNDGQRSFICPQAAPAWGAIEAKFLSGTPIATLLNQTNQPTGPLNLSSLPKPDPRTTEDCLFLDVLVPQSIYDARSTAPEDPNPCACNCDDGTGAPVLVWIYGGGYTFGNKAGSGNAAGILASARKNNETGVIYVALNYRLGLYGWLAGPTFQANGTANAGLYDQELALQWIKKNIRKFGGNPNKVTVIGESAGGGSIMHQITAYGGLKGKVPFQQAISQSPGFLPMNSNAMIESIYQQTLQVASLVTSRSINTTQDLRAMSDMELYYTNVILVGTSPYGSFTFGPVVDGKFVPKLPGELLLHGQFDSSVKVMVGHNLNEGLTFASPFISNESTFATYVRQTIPAASSAVINTITQTLYPPVFDGTYGYKNQLERTSLLISEFSFTCNTRYLDLAYMNQTYSYYFTVPPGFHGEDIAYTFFNGDLTTLDNGFPVNTTVAGALQSYITSFAESGTPNLMSGMGGVPYFPIYGMNSSTQLLSNGSDFGTQVKDTSANARCDYLQKALYI